MVNNKTNIEIVKVDDLYVGHGKPKHKEYNPYDFADRCSRFIEFLPGLHGLSIRYTVSASAKNYYGPGRPFYKNLYKKRSITIMFTVEAGHIYNMTYSHDWMSLGCDPEVEDVTDSKWGQRWLKRGVRKHER